MILHFVFDVSLVSAFCVKLKLQNKSNSKHFLHKFQVNVRHEKVNEILIYILMVANTTPNSKTTALHIYN